MWWGHEYRADYSMNFIIIYIYTYIYNVGLFW